MASLRNRFQFQALFSEVMTYQGTLDVASLVDAAGSTSTAAVPGAALGDFALATLDVSLAGISVTAWVSAADVVSVRFQNESGGTLDLASANLRIVVLKPAGSAFFA